MSTKDLKEKGTHFLLLTGSTLLMAVGTYFFKFTNNFTFGGITGLAVLIANAAATFRRQDSAQFCGRRIDCSAVKTAATILTMYLALFFGGGVFISVYEDLPLSSCLYEAASAVGTVGLTLGITPQLHIPSQMVLIALMYLGRVGGLTLIYAAVSSKKNGNAKLPQERITIG